MLALLAATFMCFAAFHGAAHDHEDDDHGDRQDCYAFHLVAQTPLTPPADITIDFDLPDVLAERAQPEIIFVSHSIADRQTLPRGPPLQSFAT